MKLYKLLLFCTFSFSLVLSQTTNVNTEGDNSPAVIAKKLSITYGVRTDAIEAILWIYEAESYDTNRRKIAIEEILREYSKTPEKLQRKDSLSQTSLKKMGILNAPKIVSALEWDLFADNYYLSTSGHNSPAVLAKGIVNIWYGISPKILRALAKQLEKNKTELKVFETKLVEQVKKYEELKTELKFYKNKEEIYGKVEALLEKGKLEEAEELIESDFYTSTKRQAYKGFVFGKTKELLLKYHEASQGYKIAISNDEQNITYRNHLANIEKILNRYDKAIVHYESALKILDTLTLDYNSKIKGKSTLLNNLGLVYSFKGDYYKAIDYFKMALDIDTTLANNESLRLAKIYNNLGFAFGEIEDHNNSIKYLKKALKIQLKELGDEHIDIGITYNNFGNYFSSIRKYEKALQYHKKALKINISSFGDNHPNVAATYACMGTVYNTKKEYDSAMNVYQKALKINQNIFGNQNPNTANSYNSLGVVLNNTNKHDKAIEYHNKALAIELDFFNGKHPNTAITYNNLGVAYIAKKNYNKAIDYFKKSIDIDSTFFGIKHSKIAIRYNNIGLSLVESGKYDQAIKYYTRALEIYQINLRDEHPKISTLYNNIGLLYEDKKQFKEAIQFYEKALEIDIKVFGDTSPNVALLYENIASSYLSLKNYKKAIENYQKALNISNEIPEDKKYLLTELSFATNTLGQEYFKKKDYRTAIKYFEKSLKYTEDNSDVGFSLTNLYNLGYTYYYAEDYNQSILYYDKAIQKAVNLKDFFNKRRIEYHKILSLKSLKKINEANQLAEKVWNEAKKTDDNQLLKNLKKEGYDF